MKYLLIVQLICMLFLLTLLSSPGNATTSASLDKMVSQTIEFINKPKIEITKSRKIKTKLLNKNKKIIFKKEFIQLIPLFEPIADN